MFIAHFKFRDARHTPRARAAAMPAIMEVGKKADERCGIWKHGGSNPFSVSLYLLCILIRD